MVDATSSIYISHYTRLRAACFGLMLHGIGWDAENASRLRDKFDSKRQAIKEEILKLTDGFPLWSLTTHRSEEMKDALCVQKTSRADVKRRRAELRAAGLKPKAIKAEIVDLELRAGDAELRVSEIKVSGRHMDIEIGAGLSDDAIAKWFYGKLGIAPIYKLRKETRTRTVTVDDIALKRIRQTTPNTSALVDLIREHRKCTKLVSTYLDPGKLDVDGRLRCMYKTYGTNSGRLASAANPEGRGLNLQNIDSMLKPLLIPDAGE